MQDNQPLSMINENSDLGYLEKAYQTLEGIERIAEKLASCATLPAHIKNPADAFRIVCQAAKWRMDPFAVAECTSLVHGKLCIEGKLISAVVHSMGVIDGRLSYEYFGEKGKPTRGIKVRGKLRGGEWQEIVGTVAEWQTTGNGSPWAKQPDAQLVYRGTRQWARLYAPDALLGVYTPDEIENVRTVNAEDVTIHKSNPEMPEDKFTETMEWAKTQIVDKGKTADYILKMVGERWTLTDEQAEQIKAIKVTQ